MSFLAFLASIPCAIASAVQQEVFVPSLLAIGVLLVGVGFFLFRPSFSAVSKERTLLTFAVCWALLMGMIFFGFPLLRGQVPDAFHQPPRLLVAMKMTAFLVFAVPFALRLHSKWLGGKATAEEMKGGAAGVKAWLSPIHCGVAIVVAVLLWVTFDLSLVAMLMLSFALLLAFPVMNSFPAIEEEGPTPDSGGTEREKVLAMLESGRITAEESAELLNALAASRPSVDSRTVPLTPAARLVLIGAGLVLVGFFFPWFSISPGQELARAMHGMRELVGANLPMELPILNSRQSPSDFRISVIGSEIQHGWGWLVLGCAMTSALLPFFAKSMDRATLRLLRLLALGVGSVVLLSVVGSGIRWISFGLVAVIAGYAVQWLGLMREKSVTISPAIRPTE